MLILRMLFSLLMGNSRARGEKAAFLQMGGFGALAIALHDLENKIPMLLLSTSRRMKITSCRTE
ncbi:hypothetical protein, partial [Effusibacillus consociatus]|uniref:hypothetical protein n=1 Tax=Effusibacillus consociatus TaxID=1117041 RepID=UPI0036D20E1D